MNNPKHFFAGLFILGWLAGCAEVQTGTTGSGSALEKDVTTHYRFSDVPVPGNFKLDREKSFIYEAGNGKMKMGRLIYSGSGKIEELAAFYQNEMVSHGWKLVRTIEQSGISILYEKEGWTCFITLTSSFLHSTVEIQVGPR